MNPFDIIKAARIAIAERTESTAKLPSEKSMQDYQRMAKRLIHHIPPDAVETIKRAADTRSAATWFKRRAALQWYARNKIQRLLKEQDSIQRILRAMPDDQGLREEWLGMIEVLESYCTLLAKIPIGCPIPQKERKPRHSKRKDLAGLPPDWREKLLMRMEMYRLPYLAAAITGCRPEELNMGILFMIRDGELHVSIDGAKVKEKTGQPWREMSWKLPREGLVSILATAVKLAGGSMEIRIDSPRNFSTNIRDAAKHLWPNCNETVTPYCLRHQFAADMKASGASDEDIAKAMGHCAVSTAQYYGTARQSRGRSVHPDRVEAAREVRKAKAGAMPHRRGPTRSA